MEMNPVPDAISATSRERILELLLRSPVPLTVQALAAALGISRNAAHQHVAALERDELIERGSSVRTKGRPSRGFRLTAAGRATFPRQYSLLAKQLLAELSRVLEPNELRRAMNRIGKTLADGLSPPTAGNSDEALIAGLMRELGYEAQVIETPNGSEIEAHNCGFHDLAQSDRTICEIDLALLRSLSGREVDHRRCMARGEASCRFAFRERKPQP